MAGAGLQKEARQIRRENEPVMWHEQYPPFSLNCQSAQNLRPSEWRCWGLSVLTFYSFDFQVFLASAIDTTKLLQNSHCMVFKTETAAQLFFSEFPQLSWFIGLLFSHEMPCYKCCMQNLLRKSFQNNEKFPCKSFFSDKVQKGQLQSVFSTTQNDQKSTRSAHQETLCITHWLQRESPSFPSSGNRQCGVSGAQITISLRQVSSQPHISQAKRQRNSPMVDKIRFPQRNCTR